MSDDDAPTPPTRRLPRLLLVRGAPRSAVESLTAAAARAHLFVEHAILHDVEALASDVHPIVLAVPQPVYDADRQRFESLADAVGARLLLVPLDPIDPESILSQLLDATDPRAAR